jgi:hypothetical protein
VVWMLVAASLGLVAGLIGGGRVAGLARVPLRLSWLVLVSLAVQVVAFTPLRALVPELASQIPAVYLGSMGLLVVWVGLNYRVPGMALLAAGLLSNLLAIAANGGYMPVSAESLRVAGRSAFYGADQVYNNSAQHQGDARLVLLTDILAAPAWLPFANVFSIGDVLICLGAAWFCYRATREGRRDDAPGSV